MSENEAINVLKMVEAHGCLVIESKVMAIKALEEIQQYRAYKEIFESHFSKEALELLSDKAEFGKWLERGKWIAKKCDEINRKLEGFEAIGTIEEFKALKKEVELYRNLDKTNFSDGYNKAIDEFAEEMKWEYRESIGTSEREIHFALAVIDQVAERLKGGAE